MISLTVCIANVMTANAKTELTPSDQVTLPVNSKLVATTKMSLIGKRRQANLSSMNHFKFITPAIEKTNKRTKNKVNIKAKEMLVEVSTVYTLPKDFEFTENKVVYKTAADMEVTLPDGSYTVDATNCSLFNCLENKQENFSIKESTEENAVPTNKVIEALEIFEVKATGKYVLTLTNGEYTIDASCLDSMPFRLFEIDGTNYALGDKDNFEFVPQNVFLVDKSDTNNNGAAVEKAMLSRKGTFLFSTVKEIEEGISKTFSKAIQTKLDMTNNAEVKVTPTKTIAITTADKSSEPETTGDPDKNTLITGDPKKDETVIPETDKKTGTGETKTQTTEGTTEPGEKTDTEEESTSQGMSGTTITIIVVVVVIAVLAACIGLFYYYYKFHVLKKNPVELGKEEDTEI